MKPLENKVIQSAFEELDRIVPEKLNILIGGGAAILIQHIMPISTLDIDAIPFKSKIGPEELKTYRERVAQKLGLSPHWINEYFYQFTHCLPTDYGDRLKIVFTGKHLTCYVLHPTDIAIMKLFAHRGKDDSHLRALIKSGLIDLKFIETHLEKLVKQRHPNAESAKEYFFELTESMGIDV